MPTIALGSDHAGFPLKELAKAHLQTLGYPVLDFGTTNSETAVDYPDFILPAAQSVAAGQCDLGIVFGGSGNGEAMVANKVRGIRCAVCWNAESARLAREHNNANVIAIGGRLVSAVEGIQIIDTWLAAVFEGGRHQRRLDKIAQLEALSRG